MDNSFRIKTELNKLGLDLSRGQSEMFREYCAMLIKRNEGVNLTAITDEDGIYEKHFLDSLSLAAAYDLKSVGTLADVGTGAGFPGIPLKIMFPEIKVTLVDSLGKRVDFLREVIDKLGLGGITAVHARAEDMGKDPFHRESFDMCVSRAVAPMPILLEYCLPLVKKGGAFAAYKTAAEEELEMSANALEILGGVPEAVREMKIGPSGLKRSIIVIRKTKSTPEKYPRKAGKAKKKPL